MKKVDQDSQNRAAKAWVGRWIKDGFENRLGLVKSTAEVDGELFLKAEFVGGEKNRTISLDPRPDGECLTPEMPKARYKPASEADVEKLRQRIKNS